MTREPGSFCTFCGRPSRYSVGDVFQCKGGCAEFVPEPELEGEVAMMSEAEFPEPEPAPRYEVLGDVELSPEEDVEAQRQIEQADREFKPARRRRGRK